VMSRYFPDPYTPRLAEFILGNLRITAAVDQVVSQAANVVEISIKADSLNIGFSPTWSSQPVSAEDLAGIIQAIRNALKTSALPSNASLPSNVEQLRFKTLLGTPNAIAVLLNLVRTGFSPEPPPPPGNPGSANRVFLGGGDDFAFAVGREFIEAAFKSDAHDHRFPPVSVYTITVTSRRAELQQGRIVMTIKGKAHTTSSWLPDFSFTAKLAFALNLVATKPAGPLNTAELAFLTIVSLNVGGVPIPGWLANRLVGTISLQQDQRGVRDMLSVDRNLGDFLTQLMNPALPTQPQAHLQPELAYTSVEIQPSGIVLHGSLVVPAWPPAHVEFQQIPGSSGGGVLGDLVPHGPDYSALKTWIPGGKIEQYEWSSLGQAQPFLIDKHKFVLLDQGPQTSVAETSTGPVSGGVRPEVSSGEASTGAVSGFTPLCLTVKGARIASSGPAVAQPVTATVCGYTSIPVIPAGLVSALKGVVPLVALTQPGPRGVLKVTGHASAWVDEAGGDAPNLVVHFADDKTAARLEFLTEALRKSRRGDAPTAVVGVLTPDRLAKARHTAGVIYAEDQGDAWEHVFRVKTTRRPLTLIVVPKGDVVWQHEGELDSERLADALRGRLAKGRPVRPSMLRVNLRIGWPPPNFLFEYAPGRGLTLRKLSGRPVVLVFWKSSSKPSIEAVRDVQQTPRQPGTQEPVVLAINDGEAPELVKSVAAEHRLSAIVVPDPKRQISLAYGVNMWPTIVFLDASGLVSEIRYGRVGGDHFESPSKGKAAGRTVSEERS
jgi:cytochrome c biogenesis protein CcmG, thiol:disulfide interchange protein DsbE